MKKRTVVFDLDGALETPYYREYHVPKAQAWMKSHQTGYVYEQLYVMIEACNEEMPHLIFPGTLELLRWVHDHGFDIVFFSNAVTERNEKLCPILMERAFGKDEIPPYTAYGHKFPTDGIGYEMVKKSGVFIPGPPNREFKAYVEGLRELRQYNSCLRFWGAVDENADDWPKEC